MIVAAKKSASAAFRSMVNRSSSSIGAASGGAASVSTVAAPTVSCLSSVRASSGGICLVVTGWNKTGSETFSGIHAIPISLTTSPLLSKVLSAVLFLLSVPAGL